MTLPTKENPVECVCGASIFAVVNPEDGEIMVWVDTDKGSVTCYPDAYDENDRMAKHEPYEWSEDSQSGDPA